jgi:Protein of unknown function (DUF2628)
MSVYTVHEPPLRAAEAAADPERFAFVRDGFSIWAFLLAPLWMLWHRLWLVLAIYVVLWLGIEAGLLALGASTFVTVPVALFIALLVGLEAGTFRRFTLARRGWRNVGIISGDDLEDAERRFFDAWLRQARSRPSAPVLAAPVTPPPAPALHRVSQQPGVIGLFPEPGAHR